RIEFLSLVTPARKDVGQKRCAKKAEQGETDTEIDGDHSSAWNPFQKFLTRISTRASSYAAKRQAAGSADRCRECGDAAPPRAPVPCDGRAGRPALREY